MVIVASFWGATWINWLGMRSSSFFSNICAISGLLIPMALIISLGAIWVCGGNISQIHIDKQSIMPHWTDTSLWISLTAVILSFCGIEIATVHANDVHNPQRAFPIALIYSVAIILVTLILGSLTIAVVLPQNDINLVAGIMQAFSAFFVRYHLEALMPLVALMLILGGLGSVSNWIIAPTKGLLVAGEDGNLPSFFLKHNKHHAPVVILIIQAVIVTLLSTLFIFMPSINSSYWLLTALAAQLYMMMYLLMLAAVIKLRISQPHHPRAFRIPGGLPGLLIVAGIGIIGVLTTIFFSFMPPDNINVGNTQQYELTLGAGLILMSLPPFILSRLKNYNRKTPVSAELV